ncbi:MAG: hypothetical protein CMN76_09645 [Spirochaetaceae bacterium]|nr:hypothetical protein [Spirochaetaceae bacterium]|tara:strand:+ start:95309 stop:96328 length:1020 start_codon:yes stop_codon:yes gene_type:complete
MENENQNRMEGLPSELMEGLRNPPRLEVPAFDPAWLDKEPAHLYRPEPTKGKLLSFPVLGGLSAVAAAALVFIGIYFVYPAMQGSGNGSAPEIYGAATGDGISLLSTDHSASGWNMGSLTPGQTVRTGGETLDIIASNGVLVRLYPETVVEIRKGEAGLNLLQKSGQLLAEVNPGGAEFGPVALIVDTPHSRVRVTGTVFHLSVDEQATSLYLDEGSLTMGDRSIPDKTLARQEKDSAPELNENPEFALDTTAELRSLRANTDQLARKWIPEMKRLDQVRGEKEISEMYGQSLEKIILKDGRILQGVVASQQGDRLMLHTTSGVVVVRRQDVQEIVYEN